MSEDKKQHEYELLSHGKDTESLGTVWWDGKKVVASDEGLEALLRRRPVLVKGKEINWDDGIEFLEGLPHTYRSYIHARKV